MSADPRPIFTPYPPPQRVQLLRLLTREWQSSPELARRLDVCPQGVAARLRVFMLEGIVERRGRGVFGPEVRS